MAEQGHGGLVATVPFREGGNTCQRGSLFTSCLSFCLSFFASFLLSVKICYDGERARRNRTVCSSLLREVPKAVTVDTPEFSQRRILSFRTRPPVPVEMYSSEPGLWCCWNFPHEIFNIQGKYRTVYVFCFCFFSVLNCLFIKFPS